MTLEELMVKIDEEQNMVVCIGDNNEYRIEGDQVSISRMISDAINGYEVDCISARADKAIWVWLKEND